jgi:tryptophan synthase alpha chain
LEVEVARARSACDAPIAVGFGVSTAEDAARVAACADGVIVGSAIIKEAASVFSAKSQVTHSAETIAEAADHVERLVETLLEGVVSVRKLEQNRT